MKKRMSLQEGHMGYAEAVLLVLTAITVKLLLPFPAQMARLAGPAGWMVVVGIVLWGTLGALVLSRLMQRFPDHSLPEVVRKVTGEWPGLVINLGLVVWLVADGSLVLRMFTETFIASVLPRTPPSTLSFLALAVALYAGYLGLESIARANLVIWPVMGAAFLTVLFFTLPQARLDWLFPLWGPGPATVAVLSLQTVGVVSEVALLAIYGFAFRRPGELRRSALHSLWAAGAALTVTVAIYVAVFGAAGAAHHPFPFFGLARMVYVGRFFQRMEAVFVLFWILGALIRLSIMLHAAAVTLTVTLRAPYYRPLLFPLALLMFSLGLVPPDFVSAMRVEEAYRLLAAIPAFVLPLLLLAGATVRRGQEVPTNG